jgi:hypothetical protein
MYLLIGGATTRIVFANNDFHIVIEGYFAGNSGVN